MKYIALLISVMSLSVLSSAQASTLTVTYDGNGTGSIQTDPGSGSITSGSQTYTIADGTVVTVVAKPDSISQFVGWNSTCSTTAAFCQFTMNGDRSVTALIDRLDSYRVSTSTTGSGSGTVTRTPVANTYVQATEVTFTATANTGSSFGGWTSGCSGSSTTCKLTITSAQTVTARFNAITGVAIATDGTGGGNVTQSPSGTSFPDGTLVTLTAASNVDSEFAGWSGGGCSGLTLSCVVTAGSTGISVTATFNRQSSYTLTATATGSGTIARNVTYERYTRDSVVTLTATADAGYAFRGWTAGLCASKVAACQITMNKNQTVEANFSSPVQVGTVFSAKDTTNLSFLRLFNADSAAGTAKVTMYDASTGVRIGEMTTASIPVNAEVQIPVSDIEVAIGVPTKPTYYTLVVSSAFQGTLRHVVWSPSQETFTNLSTCSSSPPTDRRVLAGVHASRLSQYPSLVAIHNTGPAPQPVALAIYDANDGAFLGSITASAVPARSEVIIPLSDIERNITVTNPVRYVIKMEGALTGFIQHLVTNVRSGVVADISTACAL